MNRITLLLLSFLTSLAGFGQALTDGEYLIKINQTGKYFAIAGADKNSGGRLVQWDNEYSSHFKFILKHLGNNVYTIKAKHSGKYLSTEGSPAAGAKIIQWDWVNQDNQKWYILPQNGSKGYVISCYQNNMKMVLQYWNSTVTPQNGAYFFLQGDMNMRAMTLDFKKNETDQVEGGYNKIPRSTKALPGATDAIVKLINDVPDGIYKIRVNESGKYLAIAGQEDQHNGVRLIQWDMLPRNNHLFDVRKQDDGSYTITPVHSQKVLDVVDMRTEDGTQVQQWDNLNSANQRWKFYNEPTGVSIRSMASGKKLQLSAGPSNSSNGTTLIITNNGTQTFTLYPARAVKFTEYITIKNLKLTVPKGGDVQMFGYIYVDIVNKAGDCYYRYYITENMLWGVYEKQAIDMDQRRTLYPVGEVKLKINSEELAGSKIIITYGINENDADVASLFTSFGSAEGWNTDPNQRRTPHTTPYVAGGSDDYYLLKNSFNDCLKSKLEVYKPYKNHQTFYVADIPASCNVHVNLQDEDGSDNWFDVYFTIIKERK